MMKATGSGDLAKRLPLHYAAKKGDLKDFKQAFKSLAKKQGKSARVVDAKDDFDQTPLHVACGEGKLEIAKYLIDQQKANINVRDKNNWTPLHFAASGLKQAHVKICAFLLERGAEAEARTNDLSSPLHYFVRMEPEDVQEFHRVLTRLANPEGGATNSTSSTRDKFSQVKAPSSQRVLKLVNAQDTHGETALHHAATTGRQQAAIFLHHLGADVNLQNKYGETPLISAIRNGRAEMAHMLLSLEADPKIESDAGTALELAESHAMDDVVAAIKGESADKKSRGKGAGESFGFNNDSDDDVDSDNDDDRESQSLTMKHSSSGASNLSHSSLAVSDQSTSSPSNSSMSSKKYPLPMQVSEQGGIPLVTFHCGACGSVHTSIALNYHAPYPALWGELQPAQREESRLSLDLCSIILSSGEIKHKSWFVRALIEISVTDAKDVGPFTWGVWVAVGETDFKRIVKMWNKEGRDKETYFGLLQTSLPYYKVDTKNIKLRIHSRAVGQRPWLEIAENTHEIYAHQKDGINSKKLAEMLTATKHWNTQVSA